MNRTPIAIALSFMLAAGAASAIAADGDMKQAYPSATATSPVDGQGMTGTKPYGMRGDQKDATHGETGRGQGSGLTMTNSGEKSAEAREAQRADKPVQPEPRGETARGQGSGVAMSNRGEVAAEAREAQRGDKPVQAEPLGETARGQGSGVTMKDGTQGSMAK
jgi:hypothetical protein